MAFKLGKLPAELSDKDLLLKSVIKTVTIPTEYDFDSTHPGLPYPMFANDEYGCCVMSGRAHQTLRFELVEQKKILSITDQDVLKEYFAETGGDDSGLIVSRSLREWRRKGWIAAGSKCLAKAYARINHRIAQDIRAAIYADVGVGIGFTVMESAMDQFDAGKPWDLVAHPGQELGGHYVYLPAYQSDGSFTCVTWGKRQKMTERFLKAYCDEAWAVWDAANPTTKMKQMFDLNKIDQFLDQLPPT